MNNNDPAIPDKKPAFVQKIVRLYERAVARTMARWVYCSDGVWEDHRNTLKVNIIKTINLTVKTFMSTDLQSKACAMTYRTLLAVVPILALAFAILRGFGFQNMLTDQLFTYFPSQRKAIEMAMGFVDSSLAQASEGVFVGVGIVFLLWTVISLLDSVEESFNRIWGVTVGRSIFRKVTDYLAICIILPILMICSGGLQILMSNAIQRLLPFDFMTPVIEFGLDCVSFIFAWLFFAGAYMLIPNAKVKFKNAFPAGVIAGTAFQVLQWLFASGQIYVSKYNAIYGSFSFLPLMLIWMQLSWLITLAGALICCSAQNISTLSYGRQIDRISDNYRRKISLAVLSVILKRFASGESPLTSNEIAEKYNIPVRLVGILTTRLLECGLIVRVAPVGELEVTDMLPLQPSTHLSAYTVSHVLATLENYGDSEFLPGLDSEFPHIWTLEADLEARLSKAEGATLLSEL